MRYIKTKVLMRDRAVAFRKTSGRCWYCGIKLNTKKYMMPYLNSDELYNDGITANNFSVDHLVPESRGGSNNINNIVPCCRHCNAVKNSMDVENLRRRLWDERFENKFSIRFSTKQKEFIGSKGMDLHSMIEEVTFYFEQGEEI